VSRRVAALHAACFAAAALGCQRRSPASLPSLPVASAPAPPPTRAPTGAFLVAIETPRRTYLTFVRTAAIQSWDPRRDGWPALAVWERATEVRALRHLAFEPGQKLEPAQIVELLPALKAAPTTLDITAPPYAARKSPWDASAVIQAALNDAGRRAGSEHPVDVVVPGGTYDHRAVLHVPADVRLRGEGGVLRATNAKTSAVHLAGDRSAVLFLTLEAQASERLAVPDSDGIWVGPRTVAEPVVHDTLVIGNSIIGPAGAHVFGMAEDGGLWAFNEARDGYADAFHHTGGSRYCQVVANRASGPGSRGDDLYAFIGYHGDGDPVHHCDCLANWGRDGFGRGLAAVGAGYIDFEDNDIVGTKWAGVYIAQESSYDTYGSFSVTVRRNHIVAANRGGTHDGLLAFAALPQTSAPSRSFGEVSNRVVDLTVSGNTFADTAKGDGGGSGIRVRNGCARGQIEGNKIIGGSTPGIVVSGERFELSANVIEDAAVH